MPSLNCVVFVNGQRHEVVAGTLLHCTTAFEYLRNTFEIRSLKFVSASCTGGCNLSSTIMVTSLSPSTGVIDGHKAVDALSTPIIGLHGCAITTLEAIGSRGALHPIQARLVAAGANPCGYCTPGLSMLLYTLLMSNPQPTVRDIERALAGVWCRCSGFRCMYDAAFSFACDFDDALKAKVDSYAIDSLAPVNPESTENYPPLSETAERREILSSAMRIAALRKQFPLYPHEHLKPPVLSVVPPLFLFYGIKETAFLLPTSVDEVLRSCKVVPDYTTVHSASDFHHMVLTRVTSVEGPPMAILSTSRVKEMLEVNIQADPSSGQMGIFVGAAATFSSIMQRIPKLVTPELSSKDPWTVAALLELRLAIEELSVSQVEENSLTLVSHMLARPCGDLVPLLHCLRATLIVLTNRGREEFSVVEVTGASRSIAKLDVVLGLFIPPKKNRFVGFAKATLSGPRAPATTSIAIACDITRRDIDIIGSNFSVAAAGSSFYMIVLPDVAAALDRTNLSTDTVKSVRAAQEKLLMSLRNLVHGPSDGRVSYRITATRSLIFRLFCRLQAAVGVPVMDPSALCEDRTHGKYRVGFGVQSWETCYGGLFSSRQVAILDEEEIDAPAAEESTAGSAALQASPSSAMPPPAASGKLPPSGGVPSKSKKSQSLSGGSGEAAPSKSPRPLTNVSDANAEGGHVAHQTLPTGPRKRRVVLRSPVGDCIPSTASLPHVTGQTQFVSDIPLPQGCLYAAFVRTTIPKGIIKATNAAPAKVLPGVIGYFDVKDLPDARAMTGISQRMDSAPERVPASDWTQRVFVDKDVDYIGQVIGVVIANSLVVARQAAQLVSIEYVKDHRMSYCLSISESRENKTFFPTTDSEVLSVGASPSGAAGRGSSNPIRKLFENKDLLTTSGSFAIGGQFLMASEPTTVLCMPSADDGIDLHVTTEAPSRVQQRVAEVLQVPVSSVVVRTPKLGGSKPFDAAIPALASAIAVACNKIRKPVMYLSSLEEDATTLGTSHSVVADWRCAVDPVTSMIQAVDIQTYLGCGAAKGESEDVLRAILRHVSGAYHIPLLRARGILCRTNYPPSCAHVGSAQAMGVVIMENVMDAVARTLKVPRWKLQQDHLLQPNETLPYGQIAAQVRMPTLWQDLIISSDASDRIPAVELYNQRNRYRKRGISMVPILIGCRLPQDEDHRASATVTLQVDGTVRVSHGIVDCGVGVDVKVAQVVARCFKISLSRITVTATSTDVLDQTGRSGTFMAADVACLAVLNACEALQHRLDRVGGDPNIPLGQRVRAALREQIPMSAHGTAATHTPGSSEGSMHDLESGGASPVARGAHQQQQHNSVHSMRDHLDENRGVIVGGAESASLIQLTPSTPVQAGRSDAFGPEVASPVTLARHASSNLAGLSPSAHLMKKPSSIEPFAYFVQGASCAEVELDVLTGTFRVMRMDICIDGGQVLNPLVDVAVIESQVLKGAGWLTTEEVICGDKVHPEVSEGTYFNATLRDYGMPRSQDVPKDVRVAFFGAGTTNANRLGGVHGSKSLIEGSLSLGASVMFALREAAFAAREHWGETRPPFLEMNAPLTAERLRMACTDEFSQGAFAGSECAVVGSY